MNRHKLFFMIASLAVLWPAALTAAAQSAGTETLEKGRIYAEGSFWTSTQSHADGGMQVYGGRMSYGAGKNVEVGLGASFGDPYDPEYAPEIQPSVKWKFYQNEKYGLTAAGGAIAYLPVARRAGTDAFVMLYGNVSKDFKGFNEPRLTVGVYALAGGNPSNGNRKGFNFVYDQPISGKLSFSTQWTTGKNRFGYLTPGLSVAMPKNGSLFVGYSVGNSDYDNHGPYISYSLVR